MSIQKNQRALIVVNQLTNGVSRDQRWLYRFIENSGRSVAEGTLKDDYSDYVTLYDQSATKANLLNTLGSVGAKSTIKAIDLLVMLHGSPNKLVFHGDSHSTATLANELLSLNLKGKLRLVYSTACYGASHADDFVRAGFNAAIGAVGVNTNASVEFPTFLNLWSYGWKVADVLASAENPLTRMPLDEVARAYASANGFSWANDVNSDKVLVTASRANRAITIASAGQSLHNGTVLLALTFAPDPAQPIPGDRVNENCLGLDHLILGQGQYGDLQAAVSLFDAKGVNHSEIKPLEPCGFAVLAFRDPDNIQLELTASYS